MNEKTPASYQTTIISRFYSRLKCKHAKWDCDTQIRTIECRECGKRAWIEDYRSLY